MRQPMSMHDLWLIGLFAGHVKRGPVRAMQGPLEKRRHKEASLTLRRASLTRKPCSSMPSKLEDKKNIWTARAQRKCIWIAERHYKIELLSGMQHG
jgi:hypothetical protein